MKRLNRLKITLFILMLSCLCTVAFVAWAENDSLQETYFTVTAKSENEAMGTVTVTGANPNGEGQFLCGTEVTLIATPVRGYKFVEWRGTYPWYDPEFKISSIEQNLTYTAVFEPVTYVITYENHQNLQFTDGTILPRYHTYGQTTLLPIPLDTPGYTFIGWKAESNGKISEYHKGDSLGANDYQADIKLSPIFKENSYGVTCYDKTLSGKDLGTLKKDYPYATPSIPVGDWDVRSYPGYTYDSYVGLAESVKVNTTLNVVYRYYKPNSYTVTLNNNAADAVGGAASVTVTFDSKFPTVTDIPTRPGYTFVGYYYEDGGDKKSYCHYDVETRAWTYKTWDIPQNVTLKADWKKNDYQLRFDTALEALATITVKDGAGKAYNYKSELIPFNTALTITVAVKDTHKLVSWQGEAITHTSNGSFTYTIKEDVTLAGVALPKSDKPALHVDYVKEIFLDADGKIPAGAYRLEKDGAVLLRFTVAEGGSITFADQTASTELSAADYFGSTVQIVYCGDGATSADSDPQSIPLKARPAAPVGGPDKDFQGLDASNNNVIKVLYKPHSVYTFEFACSTQPSSDGNNLTWQDSNIFEGLKDGTPYYVYIRVKAEEDNHPHSNAVLVQSQSTLSNDYLQSMINKIMEERNKDIAGENVNKLVSDAEAAMRALEPSPDYTDKMEAILQSVLDNIGHARVQDQAIADLLEKYQSLANSGAYSEEAGLPALEAHYNDAVAGICAALTAESVAKISEDGVKNLESVPITYLFVEDDMKLTAEKGMDRGYKLTMSPVRELMTITAQIQRSINSKTIVLDGVNMTFSEMLDALKTLDVLAYYQLQLTHKNTGSVAKAEGPFEMRLLLPENLREETGLIVAYYNPASEEMTILKTTREGNYLMFTATQSVGNFVILGDHAVNLVGVCAALALTLLAQIIAISVILKRRRHSKQATRLNGVVLPTVALTVRFFPIPVAKAVAVLAVLTVILQIVLMFLLVKTEIIPIKRRRRRRSTSAPTTVEETPAESGADQAVEEAEDAYLPLSDEAAAAEVFDEAEVAAEDVAEDAFAETENDGALLDDADFIEPAPNPRYSLEDDFFAEDGEENVETAASAYTMEYDSETNGYSLEFDNGEETYSDEEFDADGEGFVAYDDEEGYAEDADAFNGDYEGAEGYDPDTAYEDPNAYGDAYGDDYAEPAEGYDFNAYEEDADGYAEEAYAEDDLADGDGYVAYGDGEVEYITDEAEQPEGELEYGYDVYEDEEYAYADQSEDVLRDEDEILEDAEADQ